MDDKTFLAIFNKIPLLCSFIYWHSLKPAVTLIMHRGLLQPSCSALSMTWHRALLYKNTNSHHRWRRIPTLDTTRKPLKYMLPINNRWKQPNRLANSWHVQSLQFNDRSVDSAGLLPITCYCCTPRLKKSDPLIWPSTDRFRHRQSVTNMRCLT